MWNLSVKGRKDEIEQKLSEEVAKYEAVNYYDGALTAIWPFVESQIGAFDDGQIITVKSNGGASLTFDAPFTHMLSVTVGSI